MSRNPDQAYVEFNSRLPVWRHFKKAVDNSTAQCKLCKAILKTTSGSTKGLHVHMKAIHKIDTKSSTKEEGKISSTPEIDTVNDVSLSQPSTSSAFPKVLSLVPRSPQLAPEDRGNFQASQKKRRISDYFESYTNVTKELMISRMVAKDGLPFRVFCTSEDMKSLFAAKGNNYKLPSSPNTIKLIVMNYATTLKMKVKEDIRKLKNENCRFTLSFDEWTSGMKRRFLNVNVHTVTNSQPAFWNIGLARIFGSMPSESCVQLLKEKLSEFDLSLDNDIVGITTDGASVMKKVGRLIEPLQQICYAHGIQLGITDVIYKKSVDSNVQEEFEDPEMNTNLSKEEEEVLEDNPDSYDGFHFSLPTKQVDLTSDYQSLISKLRKCVTLFKNSPTKNDILQKYIQQEFGKQIQLVLDCKTRWSSLCNMLSTYNKVKQCVAKALIDLSLASNSDFFFKDEEHAILADLENTFQIVKLAVEVLCRRDTDLVSAEHTLRFMIRKLEDLKTPLSEKLVTSMKKRISERRIIATAVLLYLKNPQNFQHEFEILTDDETFHLPSKYLIRKEIKKIIERLYRDSLNVSISGNEINTSTVNTENEDEDDLPLARIAGDSNLRAAASKTHRNRTLQEELEESLRTHETSFLHVSTSTSLDKIELLIKKEMDLYECGGTRGSLLEFAHNCLLTLVPTSVESERAFSAAGYIATDIRCRLSDSTLSDICFLRSYFQNNS